ncbi:SpoIIE family protein phosphatase [Limibacter armeniacum]|uniref:PP2C family protein-serine/threonine phosphatase n=1 Tax=Limibacter armeniacum TaxID=466084 RepID=UPI002FE542C6
MLTILKQRLNSNSDLTFEENRLYRILNFILVAIIGYTLLVTIFFLIQTEWIFAGVALTEGLLFSLFLVLHIKGKLVAARLGTFFLALLSKIIICWIHGPNAGLHLLFLAMVCNPVLFFDKQTQHYFLAGMAVIAMMITVAGFKYFEPILPPPPFHFPYYWSIFLTAVFCFLTVQIFKKNHLEYEAKLKEANAIQTSSITYAQQIQKALIGNDRRIEDAFEEAFVLNQPKDIVSGDFYWYNRIGNHQILVVGDCTGHGVPAAFLTVLGIQLLNEIVLAKGIVSPSRILSEMDKGMLKSFEYKDNKDLGGGMDLAIVVINENNQSLRFAGARRPLYYIRNKQFFEIKPTRRGIRELDLGREKPFEETKVNTKQGDLYYLFSDGFQDQFGGKNDRKFMKHRFKTMLHYCSVHSLCKQKDIMKDEFDTWKGDQEQTDDVLVIGIKV